MKFFHRISFCAFLFLFLIFFAKKCDGSFYDGTVYNIYKYKPIVLKSGDNAVGKVCFEGGVTVANGTGVRLNVDLPISTFLDLRTTGSLELSGNLILDSKISLSSGGIIGLGNHSLILDGNLQIPDNAVLEFASSGIFDGQGHNVILGKYAQLLVDGGVTVTFKNMTIKNTLSTISYPPIYCNDWDSLACFDNVAFAFNDDWVFRNGQFFVHNDVNFTGTSKFSYRSMLPSYIAQHSSLIFNPNTTFEYYPASADNSLIKMADKTSAIIFDGSTLLTSLTGIRLTKGSLYVDNKVTLSSVGGFYISNLTLKSSLGLNPVFSLDWSPDDNFLAIGDIAVSYTGYLSVASVSSTGQLTFDIQIVYGDTIFSTVWHPSKNYIAAGGYKAFSAAGLKVYYFDNSTYSHTLTLSDSKVFSTDYLNGIIAALRWRPDGNYLAVGGFYPASGNGLQIYSFNTSTGKLSASPVASDSLTVGSLDWNSDGSYIGVTDFNQISILSFNGSSLTTTYTRIFYDGNSPGHVRWSKNDKYLIVGRGSKLESYAFNKTTGVLTRGSPESSANLPVSFYYLGGLDVAPLNDLIILATGTYPNSYFYLYSLNDSGIISSLPIISSNFGSNTYAVKWNSDESLFAVGGSFANRPRVYELAYTQDNSSQSFLNSIIFGNSTIGSSQDLDVYALAAARVGIHGKVWHDSVNSSWNFQSRDSYISLDRYDSQFKITNAASMENWKKNQIIKSSAPNTLFLQDNQVWSTNMDQFAPEETFEFMDSFVIPDGQITQFSTNAVIDGQGHDLILGKYAQLLVDGGITVTFKNMTIRNTLNTISCPPIRCMDWYSQACFDNVTFAFNDDWAFRNGQFFIHNDVEFTGTSKFSYRSVRPSYITSHANMIFDPLTTFEYYPSTTDNALITMMDKISAIIFNGSTLQTTHTGLRLTVGSLYFDNKVTLSSADNTKLSTILSTTDRYYTQYAYSVDWSPNGKYLAVSGYELKPGVGLIIYGWDGSVLTEITSKASGYIYSASWSPDGNYLAVCSYEIYSGIDLIVYGWDGTSLTQIDTKDSDLLFNSVAWSPDGKYLAVGGKNFSPGKLVIYAWNGATLSQLDAKSTGEVKSVAWSPDGKFLAAGGAEIISGKALVIYYWNGATLTQKASESFGDNMGSFGADKIYSVAWNPTGTFIAVGGIDTTTNSDLRVYNWNGSSLFSTVLQDFGEVVRSVSWRSCGKYLAVGGRNGSTDFIIYNWTGSSLVPIINESFGTDAYGVSWRYDGKYLAVGGNNDPTDLIIYNALYQYDTNPQGFINGIIFGNSVAGTSQDLDIYTLGGANVIVSGKVWYDDVN